MKIPRLILILLILLFSSCATQRRLTEDDLVVAIETTPCMGDCPVFRAEIYTNGMVIYEGREHVEKIGLYRGRLSRKDLDKIRLDFEKADFFSLEDEYVESWTDLPTIWLYYSNGVHQKKVKDYYGAPESLKKLEEKVMEMLDGIEWRKKEKSAE